MTWCLSCVVAVLLGAADEADKPKTYPQAKLLMEPSQLARPEAAKKVRILDARSPEQYQAGHIVHATNAEPAVWNRLFLNHKDKKFWEKHLGGLGIDADTTVVVYGDDFREAARVWWIVRYWGVRDVRLLNGGWKGWQAAGGKTHKGFYRQPSYTAKKAKLTPIRQRLMVKDQVLEGVKEKRYQVADARSKNEYCGVAKTAKRNGAIPGARHLEWSDLIDQKTQRFKSPAELTRLLEKAGIKLDKPTVTYCQSGGRASVLAFTLELMGAKDVRNYYRSWAEWGNAEDTPIEKPK